MTVLYRCHKCDLRFDPQQVPHRADDFGWRCWHCMTDDELETLR